ncbi:hypothetical protein DTX79_08645, partial [Bacilli bacterium]
RGAGHGGPAGRLRARRPDRAGGLGARGCGPAPGHRSPLAPGPLRPVPAVGAGRRDGAPGGAGARRGG